MLYISVEDKIYRTYREYFSSFYHKYNVWVKHESIPKDTNFLELMIGIGKWIKLLFDKLCKYSITLKLKGDRGNKVYHVEAVNKLHAYTSLLQDLKLYDNQVDYVIVRCLR